MPQSSNESSYGKLKVTSKNHIKMSNYYQQIKMRKTQHIQYPHVWHVQICIAHITL